VDFFAHVDQLTAEMKGNLGLFFSFFNRIANFSPFRANPIPLRGRVPGVAAAREIRRSGTD
jgi:hypothetical protein